MLAASLRIKAFKKKRWWGGLVSVWSLSKVLAGSADCGWLGQQELAGTGGGESSLNVRLGNSKRLASFPGFQSAGTAQGLGNHLLPPFIHSYLFNIY